MAPAKQLKPDQTFREFWIRVAQQGPDVIALARDAQDREVARETARDVDDAERALKGKLLMLSNSYIGVNGAINVFQKVFPRGFDDAFYVDRERQYKADASDEFRTLASREAFLRAEADEDEAKRLGLSLRRLLKNDLTHTTEKIKFRDALSQEPIGIVRALGKTLYDEEPWCAFDDYARLLKPFQAATWPNATYFLFLADPSRWLFVKPSYLQICADRLGWPLNYASEVSSKNYRELLVFGEHLRKALEPLGPKDFIDVHTFVFSVNAPGYVAEMLPDREKWYCEHNRAPEKRP